MNLNLFSKARIVAGEQLQLIPHIDHIVEILISLLLLLPLLQLNLSFQPTALISVELLLHSTLKGDGLQVGLTQVNSEEVMELIYNTRKRVFITRLRVIQFPHPAHRHL